MENRLNLPLPGALAVLCLLLTGCDAGLTAHPLVDVGEDESTDDDDSAPEPTLLDDDDSASDDDDSASDDDDSASDDQPVDDDDSAWADDDDLPVDDDDTAPADDDDTAPADDDDTASPADDDDSAPVDDDVDPEEPEAAGICAPDFALFDGSSDTWANNGPGSTNAIGQYACVAWDESGPEYTYEFTASTTGQATAHVELIADEWIELLLGPMDDLDLFVLDGSGACDPGACVAYGDDTVSWSVSAGSTWYIVVDGYLGDTSPYEVTLSVAPTTPPS